jgi:tetratricopeptide (TPR) repeat protein
VSPKIPPSLRARPTLRPLAALALLALIGAGCSPQARKARALERADRDFAAQDYDSAEIGYRKALKLAPLDPTAIRQLAFIYCDEGLLLKALAFLRKSAELEPGNARVQLDLCLTLAAVNKPAEAAAAAKQVLRNQPGNEAALKVLAESVRSDADLAATAQFIEQLSRQDQDRASYHLARGILALARRDKPGADREFTRAEALDPQSAAAEAELGDLSWSNRDAKAAGDHFRRAAALAPLRSLIRLRQVDFELNNGAADAAKKTLAEIIHGAPDYVPALVYRMNLALKEDRLDDCAAQLEQILKRDPTNYDALLQQANLKLARNDVSGAIADYQRMEGIYDQAPMIKFQLALAYLREGDPARAENSLSQAILHAPDFELAVLLMAQLEIQNGNAPDAIASLTRFLRGHPAVAKAYLLLGQAFEAQHNPEQALAVDRRMAALFPHDPQPPYLIGVILARQKQFASARQAFEQSAAIAPTYVPTIEMLVNADLQEKKYAEAAVRADSLAQKYPKSAVPWLLRAKILTAQSDRAGAISALRQAITLDPKAENPYLLLAELYAAGKNFPLAITELTEFTNRTHSESALMALGILQSETQQYAAARVTYETLLAANPKFTGALNNLAYLESEHLNQLEDAYEVAKRARALTPDSPAAADTLGWILFRRADYPSALVLLSEAATKLPADPTVHYHLGRAQIMLGNEAAARRAFQQALAVRANFSEREDAQRQLNFLDLDPAKADAGARAALEARVRAEPTNPIALIRLAAVQRAAGAANEAAASLEAAVRLSPRDPLIWLSLAQLYSGPLGNPEKARAAAKSAHELAPDDPQIAQILAGLLFQVGDYPWALNLLVEVNRLTPNQPELTYDLGRAYFNVGKVADAESTLQDLLAGGAPFPRRAAAQRFHDLIAASERSPLESSAIADAQATLAREPASLPALAVSALAAEQRSDFPAAAEIDEKILAIDPYFAPAIRELAVLYAEKLGNDPKAFAMATKARPSYPDDPELPKIFGILEYRQGHYPDAMRWLQESLQTRNDNPEAVFYLGMTRYQLKDAGAGADLQRALDLNLTGPAADEARRTLAGIPNVTPPK